MAPLDSRQHSCFFPTSRSPPGRWARLYPNHTESRWGTLGVPFDRRRYPYCTCRRRSLPSSTGRTAALRPPEPKTRPAATPPQPEGENRELGAAGRATLPNPAGVIILETVLSRRRRGIG